METIGRPIPQQSRSRGEIWRKGATSGQTQTVEELLIDCDQDALVLKVRVGGDGGACHTGRRTCFYRSIPLGAALAHARRLEFIEG